MRFFVDFYNDESGEIKLGAIVLLIIAAMLIYSFWDKVKVYINYVFSLDGVSYM